MTARWLDVLARDFHMPVAVLAAQLHSPRALETEIARYIVREGQKDAEHLISTQRPLPAQSSPPTLREQVCAVHFARITDYLLDLREAEADAALDAMMEDQ